MRKYYLVRFEFTTPEAKEFLEDRQSGELQIYAEDAPKAVEIVRRIIPGTWNFFVLKVVCEDHLKFDEDLKKIESIMNPNKYCIGEKVKHNLSKNLIGIIRNIELKQGMAYVEWGVGYFEWIVFSSIRRAKND